MPDLKTTKPSYRSPSIVEIGSALELTGAIGTPVRDNPTNDTPAYFNANPDPEAGSNIVELEE